MSETMSALEMATMEELWGEIIGRHRTAVLVCTDRLKKKGDDQADVSIWRHGWNTDALGLLAYATDRTLAEIKPADEREEDEP